MKTLRQQAFSLIELMITVGIAGILLMLAAPQMSNFMKNDRLTSVANTLIVDLMLARSEAVKQNTPTILCPSSNQTTCDTGGNFGNGWILGIDSDSNGTLDNTETILKVQQAISPEITFSNASGNLSRIIFDSRGFTPTFLTSDVLSICDARANSYAKTISFSKTGRISRGGTPSC